MTENSDLIKSLKQIVKPYVQDQKAYAELNEQTDFINDLKINSANLIDVVLDVEDHFDVTIENDELEQMVSVKSAIAIIEKKLNNK